MSTFTNKKKNYLVMWKGGQNSPFPTWNSGVPKNSRPSINGPNNGPKVDPQQYAGPFGKPYPLKIWRKQLGPAPKSGKGLVTIDQINAPGGSVFVSDTSDCVVCKSCTLQYTTQQVRVPEVIILNGNPVQQNAILINITDPYFIGRTLHITGSELAGSVYLSFPNASALGFYIYFQFVPYGIYNYGEFPNAKDITQNNIGSATFLGTTTTFTEVGGDFNWSFTNPWTIVNGAQGNSDTGLNTGWNTALPSPLENYVNFSSPSQYKYINVKIFEDYTCSSTQTAVIKSTIYGNYSYLTAQTPNEIYQGSYYTNIALNQYEKCISCDPESNIIKPGMVQPIANNFTDNAAYLQSKCSTYEQNLTTEKIVGNTYNLAQGEGAWPSDSPKGAQQFNMPTCNTNCSIGKTIPTIYKPNNRPFAKQGGTSASTRTFALKQNTLTYYNNPGLSANGLKEINYGRFTEEPVRPYYLKNQFNICHKPIYRRPGNPTACWRTPISDMYHQSLTTKRVNLVSYCQKNVTIYSNINCNYYTIGPDNNIQTNCFNVAQNTILTNVTSSFYTSNPIGGTMMAVLYDCSNNIPLLTSNIIELPYSPSVGIQPFTFYFATQNKYEQPSEDKNFTLLPGIDYCIKFESTTQYRYQMCFQTKCIVVDVQGYYYSKYC